MTLDEQLKVWAEKYGKDFPEKFRKWKERWKEIRVCHTPDGKELFFGKPDRKTVGLAMNGARVDPMKMADVMIANNLLYADESIDTKDPGFLTGLTAQMDDIIGTVKLEIKNY